MNSKIRIVIIHPDIFAVLGIRTLLASQADLEIVADSRDYTKLDTLCTTLLPNILLIAIRDINHRITSLIEHITKNYPGIHILALALEPSLPLLLSLNSLQLAGYLAANDPPESIIYAIRSAVIGGTWLSAAVMHNLSQRIVLEQAPKFPTELLTELTEREREVLKLLGQGLTNQQIAQKLGIAQRTVRFHNRNICDKLHLASRGETIAWASKFDLTLKSVSATNGSIL